MRIGYITNVIIDIIRHVQDQLSANKKCIMLGSCNSEYSEMDVSG